MAASLRYWETIPPGLLVRQIQAGGTITVGNMTWTVHADVYAAGLKRMETEIKNGYVTGPAEPYVTNTLTIMVPKGNPANITSLKDLAKPGVRLVMPNPEFEGIGRQIKNSLAKAGGDELVRAVGPVHRRGAGPRGNAHPERQAHRPFGRDRVGWLGELARGAGSDRTGDL